MNRRQRAAEQAALVDHLTDQLDRVTDERNEAAMVVVRLLTELHELRAQVAETGTDVPDTAAELDAEMAGATA